MARYYRRTAEQRKRERQRREDGREAIRQVLEQYNLPEDIRQKLENFLPKGKGDGGFAKFWQMYRLETAEAILNVMKEHPDTEWTLREFVEYFHGQYSSQFLVSVLIDLSFVRSQTTKALVKDKTTRNSYVYPSYWDNTVVFRSRRPRQVIYTSASGKTYTKSYEGMEDVYSLVTK